MTLFFTCQPGSRGRRHRGDHVGSCARWRHLWQFASRLVGYGGPWLWHVVTQ